MNEKHNRRSRPVPADLGAPRRDDATPIGRPPAQANREDARPEPGAAPPESSGHAEILEPGRGRQTTPREVAPIAEPAADFGNTTDVAGHSAVLNALAKVLPEELLSAALDEFDAEIGPLLTDPEFQHWNLWGILFSRAMGNQPGAIGQLHTFLMTPRPPAKPARRRRRKP